MKFIPLESEEQLSEINNTNGYCVIFKHNTTCPISKGVHSRLQSEEETIPGVEKAYLLDLLSYRDLSDAIESTYGVKHESPQFLLIQDGRCTYHQWGYDISAEAAAKAIKQ